MKIIELNNVTKIYRKGFLAKKILGVKGLSFSVEQGTIVGFAGPNGAGKTTTIKMIMGLLKPDSGTIHIKGIQVPNPASRAAVSFVTEQPYFYEYLTARESLEFVYALRKLPGNDKNVEIDRVLTEVRLSDIAQKKVKELSKGMQQRLNMAQALLGDFDTFLLDEPMSGLDPLGRTLFRDIFRGLAEKGKTIFFSTHIIDDIELLCDSVVVLNKGQLVYNGPVKDIVARGFLGTDLIVPELPEKLRGPFASQGYTVFTEGNKTRIFVPRDKQPQQCQKQLYEQGIFCESIEKRNESLEQILYQQR